MQKYEVLASVYHVKVSHSRACARVILSRAWPLAAHFQPALPRQFTSNTKRSEYVAVVPRQQFAAKHTLKKRGHVNVKNTPGHRCTVKFRSGVRHSSAGCLHRLLLQYKAGGRRQRPFHQSGNRPSCAIGGRTSLSARGLSSMPSPTLLAS